jgi:hemolysin activation/secretion protein
MNVCKCVGSRRRSQVLGASVAALLGVAGGGVWGQGVNPINVAPGASAATMPRVPAPPQTAPATVPAVPVASVPAPQAASAVAPAPGTMPEVTVATAPPASEPAAPFGEAIPADGKSYPVTELKVAYKYPHPELPGIGELMETELNLGVVADGYVAPRPGVAVAPVRLGDIGKAGPAKLYRSAIQAIYSHLLKQINSRGIIGVFVAVDPDDITSKDEDIRKERTSLTLLVVTSVVKQVRTVAIGEASTEERVDNPSDAFIREHSPLQPAAPGEAEQNDLLRKDVLDDYVLRLNRFPGRRVDVAISGTDKPGQLNLDYLVSQGRPWYVYAQVANTGTAQTATMRERFGFVDNELTGHDDVLSLDYSTADFSSSHAVVGSYELPFFDLERVRNRISGTWSEYQASDVGQNSQHFTGTGWTLGDEFIMNIYQHRETFIDAVAGLKLQESETNNVAAATKGYGFFIEPYVGLRLERQTDIATTTGNLIVIGYLTDSPKSEVEGLGRIEPTRDAVVLQFGAAQSFFLEPLLAPEKFATGNSTLAHELYFSARGQWAFNQRLVPQAQDVAGGLFSVRGYPESIAAGDTVVLGTAEYRFHIPRIFPVQDDPTKTPFLWEKSFRYSPQTVYGRPDWDLIFKAFVDAGQVNLSARQSYEKNATLVGAGLGLEMQIKQNVNLRLDWGVPLNRYQDQVEAGSSRLHFSLTVLY